MFTDVPQDRRRIEREAFSGNLLGIVATTALELGVDIGVLDAVIMLGFPMGNLASFVSHINLPTHCRDLPISANKLAVQVAVPVIHWLYLLRTIIPLTGTMSNTLRNCSANQPQTL
jgi:hypothetical protein